MVHLLLVLCRKRKCPLFRICVDSCAVVRKQVIWSGDRMEYSGKGDWWTDGGGHKVWILLLLCGNAHQRTSSKAALSNQLGRMTWTDGVCQLVISHPSADTQAHGAQVTTTEATHGPNTRYYCLSRLTHLLPLRNGQCANKRLTLSELPMKHSYLSRKRTRYLAFTTVAFSTLRQQSILTGIVIF